MKQTAPINQFQRPTYDELLEALDCLAFSLCPRKIIPVLKAAGYTTDIFKGAHRNGKALLARTAACTQETN